MIGKLATGMARRGILKGALGLGAAVGLGGKVSYGAQVPMYPPGVGYRPMQQALVGGGVPAERPDWLKALDSEAEAAQEREATRPRVDTLDLDIAALRGPSPAWKLIQQKARDRARHDAMKSIWQRAREGAERWYRGLA